MVSADMESRFIIFLLMPRVLYCLDLVTKDEQTFPNGTIVGTYSYFDTRGNKVQVNYFADSESYCINLKGSKMPEDDNQNVKSRSETNDLPAMVLDKMVPLKLNLPVIDNMYSIENKHNNTNNGRDITNKLDSDEKPLHYEIRDPLDVVDTTKRKTYAKGKKRYLYGHKFIKKIREALDNYSGKIPIDRN